MPNIGPVELIIILVIALLILGPGRLPDVGSALGKSIREFRKAATDVQDSVKLDAPPPTAPPPAPGAPAAVAPAQAAGAVQAPGTAPAVDPPAAPPTPAAEPPGAAPAAGAAAVEAMPEPVVASPETKS